MLELTWGGWIYIFVSVCFFVLAGIALYFIIDSALTLREILEVLKEMNEG